MQKEQYYILSRYEMKLYIVVAILSAMGIIKNKYNRYQINIKSKYDFNLAWLLSQT